jgi:hypothetical protein
MSFRKGLSSSNYSDYLRGQNFEGLYTMSFVSPTFFYINTERKEYRCPQKPIIG